MSDAANNGRPTPEDEAFLKDEFVPVLEDLTQRFVQKAAESAAADGWRPDLAEAAAALGSATFIEDLLSGKKPDEAVDHGIKQGQRQLLGEMYKSCLEEGQDRHAAFRAILAFQMENAERAGQAVDAFPEAWVSDALTAVDAAAGENRPPEEQVVEGLRAFGLASLGAAMDELRHAP